MPELTELDLAATEVLLKLGTKYSIKRTFNLKKVVKTDLELKYFTRDFEANDPDNNWGVFIQQQKGFRVNYEHPEKHQDNSKPIATILTKEIEDNGLGLLDFYYYYIIVRNKMLQRGGRWTEKLQVKERKYENSAGFYVPFSLLKHIETNDCKEHSELIVSYYTEREPLSKLYRISSAKLIDYVITNKFPLMINTSGEYITGVPIELFEEWREE